MEKDFNKPSSQMPKSFHDVSGASIVTNWLQTKNRPNRNLPSGHLRRRENKFFSISSSLFGDHDVREDIRVARGQDRDSQFKDHQEAYQCEQRRLKYEDERIYGAMNRPRQQIHFDFEDSVGPSTKFVQENQSNQTRQQPRQVQQQPHQVQKQSRQLLQRHHYPPTTEPNYKPSFLDERHPRRQFQGSSVQRRHSFDFAPTRKHSDNSTVDDFHDQSDYDQEADRQAILKEQILEKRQREQDQLEQEAYEDQLLEENAIRQREALYYEWEEEQGQLRITEELAQRRRADHLEKLKYFENQANEDKQKRLLKYTKNRDHNQDKDRNRSNKKDQNKERDKFSIPDIQISSSIDEGRKVSQTGTSPQFKNHHSRVVETRHSIQNQLSYHRSQRKEMDSLRYDHSNSDQMIAREKDNKRMRLPSRIVDDFGLNLEAASKTANSSNSYVDSDDRRRKIRNHKDKRFKKHEVGKFGGRNKSPLPPINHSASMQTDGEYSRTPKKKSTFATAGSQTTVETKHDRHDRKEDQHHLQKNEFDWRVRIEDTDSSPTTSDDDEDINEFEEENDGVLKQLSALKTRLRGKNDISDGSGRSDGRRIGRPTIQHDNEKQETNDKLRNNSSSIDDFDDDSILPEDEFKRQISLSKGRIDLDATNKTVLRSFLNKASK